MKLSYIASLQRFFRLGIFLERELEMLLKGDDFDDKCNLSGVLVDSEVTFVKCHLNWLSTSAAVEDLMRPI
jgi:hypothetical protein